MKLYKVLKSEEIVEGVYLTDRVVDRYTKELPDLIVARVDSWSDVTLRVADIVDDYNLLFDIMNPDANDDSIAGYHANGDPIYR